jgi:hypothetical protein
MGGSYKAAQLGCPRRGTLPKSAITRSGTVGAALCGRPIGVPTQGHPYGRCPKKTVPLAFSERDGERSRMNDRQNYFSNVIFFVAVKSLALMR